MSILKPKKIFIIIFLLLIAAITFFYFNLRNPYLSSVEECKVTGLKGDFLSLSLSAKVYNPNFFGAELKSVFCNIYIDDQLIGKGKLAKPTKFSAKSSTLLTFMTKVDLKKMSGLFPGLMKNNKATIKVDGKLTINTFIKTLKINKSASSQLPFRDEIVKLIQSTQSEDAFKIQRIFPLSASPFNTKLKMDVAFNNSIPVKFSVTKIYLNLYLNKNKKFGTWRSDKKIRLNPEEKKTIPAVVNLKNILVMKQFMTAAFDKKVITAKGYSIIEISGNPFKIPLSKKTVLSNPYF